MFINTGFIFDPVLILYCGFENGACQVVGKHWKYFRIGGKARCTKERIHDEGHRKGNRVPCSSVGDREQGEVMKLQYFNLDGGCQYVE